MSEPTRVGDVLEQTFDTINDAKTRMAMVRRGDREPLSKWVRDNVLLRDGFRCQWCSATGTLFHVDHITPWSAGGSDATDNLRALCAACNLERSNFQTDRDSARALLITNGCTTCCPPEPDDSPHRREVIANIGIWCAWCRAVGMTTMRGADYWRTEQITHTGYAA